MAKVAPDSAWPHIDPGKKRHRINIHAKNPTQDTSGQELTILGPIAWPCFAAIETMSTKEQFQDGFVSQVVHLISIDWPGWSIPITADMRVVVNPGPGHPSSVYEIQTVENVQQRNLVVRLVCLEIDNAKVVD
jgi:head-tail adaptor